MSAPDRQVEGLSRRRQLLADGALAAVTFIWGSTFVLVKDVVEQVPPMLFLTVRFGLAAVCLTLMLIPGGRWRGFTWREVRWSSFIGVALALGYACQTIGLQYTTASNAAFITGMQVVFAPLIGIFIVRQVPGVAAWVGVGIAAVGLAMLSLRLEQGVQVNWGDLLVLGCAASFALQVVLVARVSRWGNALRVTLVQIAVAGLLNAGGAILFELPTWQIAPLAPEIWAAATFLGVFATAVAISVQVGVQKNMSVVHAALILTLEPVFAAMFGYWLQGDRLSAVGFAGALLIVAGMLLAELAPFLWRRGVRRAARHVSVE